MKRVKLLAGLALLIPVLAFGSNFVQVKLPRGVEIEVPKGWAVLSGEGNQLISTSIEAALDISGIGQPIGEEVTLIRVNSRPKGTYAAIGVTSISPVSGSPSEIENLSNEELDQLPLNIKDNLVKLLPLQGNQMLDYYGVNKEVISGYTALVTQYRRSGLKGPVQVAVVQIFTNNQDITVNLSFRESEEALWRAVIGKMYSSISVSRWP